MIVKCHFGIQPEVFQQQKPISTPVIIGSAKYPICVMNHLVFEKKKKTMIGQRECSIREA